MYKYYVEDIAQQRGTIAIKLPMNNTSGNSSSKIFEMSRTTEEQAVSNYINLLLTMPGERFMQPNYGIGLQRRLFENDGVNAGALRIQLYDLIKENARIWLPYIINDKIDIEMDQNTIYITITFRVGESGANRTITLNAESETQQIGIEIG